MINIKLYENNLIYGSDMISVLELTPIDIYLMSRESQNIFNENIQRVINQIRDYKVQFMIKVNNMKTNDLNEHFKKLRIYDKKFNKDTEELRRGLVEKYIGGLNSILEANFIPSKKIYLCINTPLNMSINKGENKYAKASKILSNKALRITEMFSKCQITLTQVSCDQVKLLLQDSFRN